MLWALLAGPGLNESEKQTYIRDNEHLLDSLPQIPGASKLNLQSSPYCPNGATIGYITHANYWTQEPMPNQDIVDFYVRNLKDAWQYTVTNTPVEVPYSRVPPGPPPSSTWHIATLARFTRGSARIDISIEPKPPQYGEPPTPPPDPLAIPTGSYAISVDSHRVGFASCHPD
jgi:hypothetical protein